MMRCRTYVYADWKYGLCNVCLLGYGFQVKAPWLEPLFSERNRLRTVLPLGFGWRVLFFKLRSIPG